MPLHVIMQHSSLYLIQITPLHVAMVEKAPQQMHHAQDPEGARMSASFFGSKALTFKSKSLSGGKSSSGRDLGRGRQSTTFSAILQQVNRPLSVGLRGCRSGIPASAFRMLRIWRSSFTVMGGFRRSKLPLYFRLIKLVLNMPGRL